MTDHAGFLELAAQAIDFELTRTEAERLEAHLAACTPCRLTVDRLRADEAALHSFSWYDAPTRVEDVVLTAAVSRRAGGAGHRWPLAFAAALALVVLAAGVLGGGAILEGILLGPAPTIAPSLPVPAETPSAAPTADQRRSPTPPASSLGPAIRTPTAASIAASPASTGGSFAVEGSLRTLGGGPIAGASVALTATPRNEIAQVLEFTGRVPADAAVALVTIGANAEGVGPGPADLTFYEVGYSEASAGTNVVPNARFDKGTLDWGETSGDGSLTVVPSDLGSGSMMRVVVTPEQWLYAASGSFAVKPGAAFRVWAAVRVPESSLGNAYIGPLFFTSDWKTEVGRDLHPLAPAPLDLGATVTDASGSFALTIGPLEPGRYTLVAEWAGNASYWPARARTEVTVP